MVRNQQAFILAIIGLVFSDDYNEKANLEKYFVLNCEVTVSLALLSAF